MEIIINLLINNMWILLNNKPVNVLEIHDIKPVREIKKEGFRAQYIFFYSIDGEKFMSKRYSEKEIAETKLKEFLSEINKIVSGLRILEF